MGRVTSMRIVYFTHSIGSCWNHGNAHFQRGLLRELGRLGHDVMALEPIDGWSAANLRREQGETPFLRFATAFPDIRVQCYSASDQATAFVDGADLVIVHEWTEPTVVAALSQLRKCGGRFLLLFHDTHHRAVSTPHELERYDLSGFDGVLAFGASLAEVYRRRGWGRRVFVLHEAADSSLFAPPTEPAPSGSDLVWIGNWGDAERTEELERFLLRPARDAGMTLDVHGVRYPTEALTLLNEYGARYRGWLANIDVPRTFSRSLATVHVPRRFYADALPGIPTIRVFEALACGIPLISAPWQDSEQLFVPGTDFLQVADAQQMRQALRAVRADGDLRRSLAAAGHARIMARHTCRQRAHELLAIVESFSMQSVRGAA